MRQSRSTIYGTIDADKKAIKSTSIKKIKEAVHYQIKALEKDFLEAILKYKNDN